ncbi:MAG: MFS transporter [Alphaproteobacteria bacterium]
MRTILPSILALLLGAFLLMLGAGLLGTVLGVRLAEAATPTLVSGAVLAAYFAGLLLGSMRAASIVRGVGHIRAFAAFASLFSTAALAHGLTLDPWLWGVLRFVEGFCLAGLFMGIESWLNARAENRFRGQVLSLYMVTIYLAQGLGQLLLTLPDPTRFLLYVVASMLLSVSLVPVALTRFPAPELPDVRAFGFRALYAISPFGVLGAAASGVMLGAFYGMGPVFAQNIGLDTAGVARFMTAAIIGGLVLQFPLGRLSDRFDRRTVMVGVVAGLAVVGCATAAAPSFGPVVLLCAIALFGGLCFALYPLSVAHANDHVEAADMVAASSGLLLAYGVGATFGPLAGSAAMHVLGPTGLFLFMASIGALATGFGLWRMRVRPPLPPEAQAPFQVVPRTSPVSVELDPRAEPQPPETDREPPPDRRDAA